MRYWFIVFNYVTKNCQGNGNFGFESDSFASRDWIKAQCKAQSPDSLPNSVVITNFIEMTKEDYNEFWRK